MRTTLDIPEDLLAEAMHASGAKTQRAAVLWALEQALRQKAVDDLLARKVKIEFSVAPEGLEARESREVRRQSDAAPKLKRHRQR
ncbi:MAG: type II toxin-antitoxin system VapB family antitoxin [Planctomycetes bacterium]|nr:type II toxin-antitoxin system VapB family antitoxin [Planctomycetota bacterium]